MSRASSRGHSWTGACKRLAAGFGATTFVLAVQPAAAQSAKTASKAPGPPRFELRLGGVWSSGLGLGDREALLTRNTVPTGGDTPLFATSTDLAASLAFDGRLGVVLGPDWRIVAGFSYGRPELRTTISGDVEQRTEAVAVDTFDEYIVDGSIVWSPRRWRFGGGRGVPFVLGGAGYLRQLLSERAVAETGQTYHAGGGVAWGFGRAASTGPRWGLDAEARLTWRVGGVDVEDKARLAPRWGAGVFVRF